MSFPPTSSDPNFATQKVPVCWHKLASHFDFRPLTSVTCSRLDSGSMQLSTGTQLLAIKFLGTALRCPLKQKKCQWLPQISREVTLFRTEACFQLPWETGKSESQPQSQASWRQGLSPGAGGLLRRQRAYNNRVITVNKIAIC